MRSLGFTIVELLVVVLIIVTLAGLLLPSLASAKLSAHTASSAQNMKSIVQAALIYRGDYDKWPRSQELQNLLPDSIFFDPRSPAAKDQSNSHPYRIYSYAWRPEYVNAAQRDCAEFGVKENPNIALIGSPFGDKKNLKLGLADSLCDVGLERGIKDYLTHCAPDVADCLMPQKRLLGYEDGSVRSVKIDASMLNFDWISYLKTSPYAEGQD